LRYIAQESVDEENFATEAQLLRLRLDHPALILPHDAFVESPYGPPRGYLIEAEFTPPLASSLAVPQELHMVLKWGVALAHGLGYLHRHQVVLSEVGLGNVSVDDRRAYWKQLGAVASIIPPEQRASAADVFSRNVSGLANLLFYLAVGQPDQAAQAALPEPVQALFSRALSPGGFADAATFEAALEAALQELRRPSSVNLVVGRRTDVGQVRTLNEDSLLTVETSAVMRSVSVPVGLYVVADGMGGHDAGDVASGLTVRTIAQTMTQEIQAPAAAGEPLPEIVPWMKATAQTANQVVYDQGLAAGSDMGTTLVMGLFIGDRVMIANVGDSRAYLLREEEMEQITVDHSLVERLVATGQITREEAAVHPQRNVIYRVIGDKPRVEADIFEKRLAPGQALLLCSDGLSGMVPDDELWTIWRTSNSPQEACDRMVEAANRAGGEDNITVVIVEVTE
jgi:protein phosphatase